MIRFVVAGVLVVAGWVFWVFGLLVGVSWWIESGGSVTGAVRDGRRLVVKDSLDTYTYTVYGEG